MEYIRAESKSKDGKLLAIGHSMGGILLYAMLSRCGEILCRVSALSIYPQEAGGGVHCTNGLFYLFSLSLL